MYNKKFAQLYDNLFYNDFSVDTFHNLINYINIKKINNHLDLGAGTGSFCELMKTIGIDSEGIDISKDMINIAEDKGIKIYNRDMQTFKMDKTYDLITSNFDSINHVDKVGKVFKNVFRHLKKDGIFTFDFNNIKALVNLEDYRFRFEEYIVVTNNKVINKKQLEISVDIYKGDKLIGSNKVVETLYDNNYIVEALKIVGFNYIKILNKDFSEYSKKKRTRIIAIK